MNILLEQVKIVDINQNDFLITSYKINYEYVIEKKDSGGDNVFKVETPFLVEVTTYDKNNFIHKDTLSFSSFKSLYE